MPLRGICNRCGLCCLVKAPDGEMLRCMNLVLTGKPGEPNASYCAAWHGRFPDMPIYLVDKENRLRGHTTCAGDGTMKEIEDLAFKNLLGKECSLKLED